MTVNYESVAADCDIIAQKIESLVKAIANERYVNDKALTVYTELLRALNAIQEAKAAI